MKSGNLPHRCGTVSRIPAARVQTELWLAYGFTNNDSLRCPPLRLGGAQLLQVGDLPARRHAARERRALPRKLFVQGLR